MNIKKITSTECLSPGGSCSCVGGSIHVLGSCSNNPSVLHRSVFLLDSLTLLRLVKLLHFLNHVSCLQYVVPSDKQPTHTLLFSPFLLPPTACPWQMQQVNTVRCFYFLSQLREDFIYFSSQPVDGIFSRFHFWKTRAQAVSLQLRNSFPLRCLLESIRVTESKGLQAPAAPQTTTTLQHAFVMAVEAGMLRC